ncbi:MAG: ATP-binding protein [bacterium]
MKNQEKTKDELIRELDELRRRFETQELILSEIQPYVLMVVSPDRTIQMCSPAVEEIFGYRPDEIIGRTTDLLYFDRRTKTDRCNEIYDLLELQGYHIGLATGKKKGGGTLALEIVTSKLRESGGALLLVRDLSAYGWQRSVSPEIAERPDTAQQEELLPPLAEVQEHAASTDEELRRISEEIEKRVMERTAKLEKAYEDLKALDAMKDAFLSSVSHEFRTPLTSIRSFAEILLSYPGEDPQTQKEFLSIIQSESERLGRLIDNVLDLSKIKAGRMEWRFEKLAPRTVIGRAVRNVQSLLSSRQLEVEVSIQDGLPAFSGDEDRIHQVLTNLLANAIKFSPEGSRIRVEAELLEGRRAGDRTDFVHVSVADKGGGILPHDLPNLFERFNRVGDTLRGMTKGTGLGLSICKEIIAAHHGEIWAESIYGHGSTFHFTLPVSVIGDSPDFGLRPPDLSPRPKHLC